MSKARTYILLPALALAMPAAVTLATLVLFWTYPMSALATVFLGIAVAVLLSKDSQRAVALCALPCVGWMIWLYFVPISEQGYAPALNRSIMLNLAVLLVTLGVIRWQQGARHE